MHAFPALARATLGRQFVTPRTHTTGLEHTRQDAGPQLGIVKASGRHGARHRVEPLPRATRLADAGRLAMCTSAMHGTWCTATSVLQAPHANASAEGHDLMEQVIFLRGNVEEYDAKINSVYQRPAN